MGIPERIVTDMGETVIKFIPESAATKIHKCPRCHHETEFYEKQYLLLPVAFTGVRRYFHTSCLEYLLENDSRIVLNSTKSIL